MLANLDSFQTKFQPLYGYLQRLLILLCSFSQIFGFSTKLHIENLLFCMVHVMQMAATGQEMAREKRVGKMKFKITYLFFSLHFYCFLTFKILLYIKNYGHESHIYIRINFYFSIFLPRYALRNFQIMYIACYFLKT